MMPPTTPGVYVRAWYRSHLPLSRLDRWAFNEGVCVCDLCICVRGMRAWSAAMKGKP